MASEDLPQGVALSARAISGDTPVSRVLPPIDDGDPTMRSRLALRAVGVDDGAWLSAGAVVTCVTPQSGVPAPPVHRAPGSGVWGPWRKSWMKASRRGSWTESSRSWRPQALATIGLGRFSKALTST